MSDLNDPRVLFAAERTLLAWVRTSLTLMAFGFAIERFGLFIQMLTANGGQRMDHRLSFWLGIAFILIGAVASVVSLIQYRRVVKTLRPAEIPERYQVNLVAVLNLVVACLGIALAAHLLLGSH